MTVLIRLSFNAVSTSGRILEPGSFERSQLQEFVIGPAWKIRKKLKNNIGRCWLLKWGGFDAICILQSTHLREGERKFQQ